MPKVSVIIPTYNRADMLLRSIGSVLNQTYTDYELFIVDDCSTDDTEGVIRNMGDSRIQYIRLPANNGSSAIPRNTALVRATGEYVAFLDSDDEWMPLFLEKLVEKMDNSPDDVGIVYCGAIAHQNSYMEFEHPKCRGDLFQMFMEHKKIPSINACLVRRRCFDKAGLFDPGMSYIHWDMWIRLSRYYKFDYINDFLAVYYDHDMQYTKKDEYLRHEAVESIISKYLDYYDSHPKIKRIAAYSMGRCYWREGDIVKCIKYTLPSLLLDRHDWKDYVSFMLIFSPRLYNLTLKIYLTIYASYKKAKGTKQSEGEIEAENAIRDYCIWRDSDEWKKF